MAVSMFSLLREEEEDEEEDSARPWKVREDEEAEWADRWLSVGCGAAADAADAMEDADELEEVDGAGVGCDGRMEDDAAGAPLSTKSSSYSSSPLLITAQATVHATLSLW